MSQSSRDHRSNSYPVVIGNAVEPKTPDSGFRLYRFLTPLVAAVQWTGDNSSEVVGFGTTLSSGSGIVFGFDHTPLQPTATVYVAARGQWVEIERGSWILFNEESGFFTLADETFRQQFREESAG